MDEIFPQHDRKIFRYFNGKELVWGDPIAIYERLSLALNGDAASVYERCFATVRQTNADGSPVIDQKTGKIVENLDTVTAYNARAQFRDGVRYAFEMVPWNPAAERVAEAGATSEDCRRAYDAYYAYMIGQKKSGESSLTPSPPTPSAECSPESSITPPL